MRDRKMQDCATNNGKRFLIFHSEQMYFHLFWKFVTVSCLIWMPSLMKHLFLIKCYNTIRVERFTNFHTKIQILRGKFGTYNSWLGCFKIGQHFSFVYFINRVFLLNWNDIHNTWLCDAQTKINATRPLNKMNCPNLSKMVYLLFLV